MPKKKERGLIRIKSEDELIALGFKYGRNRYLKQPRRSSDYTYQPMPPDYMRLLGQTFEVELVTDSQGEYCNVPFDARSAEMVGGMYHVLSREQAVQPRASSAPAEGEATNA